MAYGARLESVLGASPRGFESPILRHRTPGPLQVPGFLLLVPRLISGRRESCPPASRPRRELRSARRLEARPCPPVPPAPSAPAAPCCCVWLSASSRSPARPRHRPPAPWPGPPDPPAPSTPAALVVLCVPAGNWGVTALLSPGLVPLDSEAFDDLCARECSQDLARHKELRSAQARADAAPSDRARRVDKEPP